MDTTPFSDEWNNYMLPSTFSPWRGNQPIDPADIGDRNTTDADAARPDRASSAFGSTHLLDVASCTTTPELTTLQDHTTPKSIAPFGGPFGGSTRAASTAENSESLRSSHARRPSSTSSTLCASTPAPSTEQGVPIVSNVDSQRSTTIMPTPPEAQSIPMTAMYGVTPSQRDTVSGDEIDLESTFPRSAKSHLECHSRRDVYIKRWSWLYVALIVLSIYSTALSGIWLVVSILQPQYGRRISTGNGWQVTPATATLLATLAAKTIELSFVTVFVAVLGQVLTRRAFSKLSRGVTLAEMTMRNWVIQPGSLITHWEGVTNAAPTLLGALTLTATVCSLFYTTASDAMVSPKLVRPDWTTRDLKGLVKTSYGNPFYVKDTCQTPITDTNFNASSEACLNILFSGQSYHSLIAFMKEWDEIRKSGNATLRELANRPTGKHNLFDNTTMDSSWIETAPGDMAAGFEAHGRVINNVTLAMPHPGVYAAATDPVNGILQPSELLGVGEYSVRASVVSPVVNVMCANMDEDELAPLIYARWPNPRKQKNAPFPIDWKLDIPATGWRNSTVVDGLFKWGEKYQRLPPLFPLYPTAYNVLTYDAGTFADAFYVLAKAPNITAYTLCELRSWLTPTCSTAFTLSGTSGGHMKAHCEDPGDDSAYGRVDPAGATAATPPTPAGDWRNLVVQWGLAINLDGGAQNNNASNARVLTNLILGSPALDPQLPSVAEALAVLVSSTVVAGSLGSPFRPAWDHGPIPAEHKAVWESFTEVFRAQVQTQQYTSAHTARWQAIFYPILGFTFVLNVLCLAYLVSGTVLTSFSSSPSPSPSPPLSPSPSPSPSSSSYLSPYPSPYPYLSPNMKKTKGSETRPSSFSSSTPFAPTATSDDQVSDDDDDDDNHDNDNATEVPDSHGGARRRSTRRGRGRQGKGNTAAAKGLVTDYTEPQNLFALAVNSPPSRAFAGSCGHGPDASELGVPWRVGYAAGANHYYFEEGGRGRGLGPVPGREGSRGGTGTGTGSGADLMLGVDDDDDGRYGKSYKRLSSRHAWL
ncbi:hypothetical protein F5Y14DRAFT_445479 [Nemania sp. NC0429]|nr:hypothetical protein F5Y14DRAFT_445479 [Nemania sp. NC0429]